MGHLVAPHHTSIMRWTLIFLGLVALVGISVAEEGKTWALLIAGSNGFYNYRHQADVCHAYHVLSKHGIPDEQIVVMMYDDIANSPANPTPGVIINHPDGDDVYAGVPKDYTGHEITPENFLNILKGNAAAMNGIGSGKVIASGPNDRVFVNFVDHGAKGILGFPSSQLHAADLNMALREMAENKQFKQMVLYIEACESGSLFYNDQLPDNINIYATTAANEKESSYACYYDKKRRTYLGDVYSVKWMEDSDKEDLNEETIYKQFKLVRQETNTSHVQEFGDLSISREDVGEFQGSAEVDAYHVPYAELQAVPSEQVPLAILYRQLMDSRDHEEAEQLRIEINEMRQTNENIQRSMRSIVHLASTEGTDVDGLLGAHTPLTQHECYKAAVNQYNRFCFNLADYEYAMHHMYALSNLCETGYSQDVVTEAIKDVCSLKLY